MRGEPGRNGIHADIGIDQDVRAVGEDLLAPAIAGQRALDEAIALGDGDVGLGVAGGAGVIAEHLKLAAIELAQPALDHQLPDRVVAEHAADDADPHLLARRAAAAASARWGICRR